ncbi:ABC transporter permease subunit [Jiangella mangrovi]|uniref:Raffinose/stachyose/melibiose transport system permease protein n=1 Tax=Jiangella mangrovi TaxID=1524084 RepID=A0A7W9GKP2_9ACTN|nr:raffinose/stachyose/melibiose transport system permease protein [Jiangella mangrovi]
MTTTELVRSATSPEAPVRPDRRNRWYKLRPKLWHLFLIPFCLLWVYPFIWMVSAAFKTQSEMLLGGLSLIPKEWTLENFERAWTTAKFGDYTLNTLTFSIAVVVLTLLASSTAGYALSKPDLPGKKVIIAVLVVTMFIPHSYTIIPVFLLINDLGLNNGLLGAALAQAGPGLVVPILLFMGFFAGIPRDLEEAARIDGAGYVRTFWRVLLPLAKPVIGTVALMNFVFSWNAFFVPLVFTLGAPELRTLGVGMFSFFGQESTDWTGLAAGACISTIPIVIVFLFLQRTFVEGIAGAVKS